MDKIDIIEQLKIEYDKLNKIADKQFEQRFNTSKYEDKWMDELYRDYKTIRIRIDLLIELLD
jgi:hypothetical protein